MAIPVGLMSPNAMMNRRIDGNPEQGYWQGDRFIFPRYKRPPMAPPMAPQGPMDQPAPPMAMPSPPPLPAIIGGDGGAGNAFGDREPAPSASANAAPDTNADVQAEMGLPDAFGPAQPGLQPAGFGVTNVAPSVAPATAVAPAVTDVDPEAGSPGKTGTSRSMAPNRGPTNAPSPATFSQQAMSLAEQVAQDLKGFSIPDLKDMQVFDDPVDKGWAATVTVDANPYGGGSDPTGPAGAGSHGNATAPDQDPTGGIGAGSTAPGGSAAGGSASSGPSGGSATSGTGPNAGDEGGLGGWRKGGRTGNDGDKRKMEPRGKAHEDEFYFNPEMTRLMDKVSPGLLDRIDLFQKGLMAPRSRGRGLMG